MRKITHLKIDNNSDWLAYQRGLPKDIRGKAKPMQIPLTITRLLGLTKAASVAKRYFLKFCALAFWRAVNS